MSFTSTVLAQLGELRDYDPDMKVFGSGSHRYQLNPTLSVHTVEEFEQKHGIDLPSDFQEYLIEVGNGGAGPSYGLFKLGFLDGSGNDQEPWTENDGEVECLARAFPHTVTWNVPEEFEHLDEFESDEDEERWREKYEAQAWAPGLMNGAFPICHDGCGVRTHLVVAGAERGKVWQDARSAASGIYPHTMNSGKHMGFADWYLDWLQKSIKKVGAGGPG